MTVWRRSGALAAVAVCAAFAVGCTATDPPARACTDIGSPPGISVTVEADAVATAMELTLRICQTDCVDQQVALQPGSVTVGETCLGDDPDAPCSASASPDGTMVGFADVATLTAGEVRVGGELRTGTGSTTLEEVTVRAEPTYPNGPDCPAGGPQAAVRVTTSGLR